MATSNGTILLDSNTVKDAHINSSAAIARSKLAQRALGRQVIHLNELRVFDAGASFLPTTAASDDLGYIPGTIASDPPLVQTSDAKATTVTQKARFSFALPDDYEDGQTITLRVTAGMNTTISDTSATLDASAYKNDEDGTISADLVTTAATTINSLTAAQKDFTIDPTNIVAGDNFEVLLTIAITDGATGTAVKGQINKIEILSDLR